MDYYLTRDIVNIIYNYIDYDTDKLYIIFKNNKHKNLINIEFNVLDLILLCVFNGYLGFKVDSHLYNINWRMFANQTKYNNIIAQTWSGYDVVFKLYTSQTYKTEDIIDFNHLLLLTL